MSLEPTRHQHQSRSEREVNDQRYLQAIVQIGRQDMALQQKQQQELRQGQDERRSQTRRD